MLLDVALYFRMSMNMYYITLQHHMIHEQENYHLTIQLSVISSRTKITNSFVEFISNQYCTSTIH